MIVLKPEHIEEIITALRFREDAITKEAAEQARGGLWPEAARKAQQFTREARVAFIEQRERHPGVGLICNEPGPYQVGSHGETDEKGRMVWSVAEKEDG